MRTRIAWTPAEEKAILDAACDILEKEPYTMSQLQLLQRAMKAALFPERVRPIKFVSTVKWFKPRVKAEMAARAVRPKAEQCLDKSLGTDAPRVASVVRTIASFTTDELLTEVMSRLFFKPLREELTKHVEGSHLVSRLAAEIVAGTRGLRQTQDEDRGNTRQDVRKKVLVVGLLNEQRQTVIKTWSELLNLRFCEGNSPNLADLGKSCDSCVLMTKFISHSTQNTLKNAGARFVFCDGGMSSLDCLLETIFDRK